MNKTSRKKTQDNSTARGKKTNSTIVSEEVGNYEKHPFFVKKANDVKELLGQVGLPKSYAPKAK